MISRRRDGLRLALLVPLLLLAAIGRARQHVDVENLAMKAVGTATDRAAAERDEQFGTAQRVLLLASLKAPEAYAPIDDREIDAWISDLRQRPEASDLEAVRTAHPGERAVAVTLSTDEAGRYARAVEELAVMARESLPPTYTLATAGVPVVELAIAGAVSDEHRRILPLLVGALGLVLLVLYRSPVLAAGTLLAPLAGSFLLEGLQGFLHLDLDPVSALVGPTVLTVGVASSVHVLERYHRALEEEASVASASAHAAAELRRPLLLTLATTVAGFLGLAWSPIPAVQRFGVMASLGVGLAILTTLLLLPSYLRLLHRPHPPRPRAAVGPAPYPWRAPGLTLLAGLLVFAGALAAPHASVVDTDPLNVLPANDPVRVDARTVAAQLGGNEVFELLLPPAPERGAAAETLAALALTAEITALPGVAAPAGSPRRSAAGYRLLSFLMTPGLATQRGALFHEAERLAREAGFAGAQATGLSVRITRDSEALVAAQRRGVSLTLALLWLVMAIGFRSPLLGLLGLVPNALPVLVIGAALGLAGRPLTVASSMIGTVMLGLVVDDTIHLLSVYQRSRGTGVERAANALREVGRPVVVTSLVLTAGFLVTLVGDLSATREFGLLAAATLMLALVANLFLLPALLSWRGLAAFSKRAPLPT